MNFTDPINLVSRKEAARILGVAVGTLEYWAYSGRYDLPVVKIGRLAKYRMEDLQDFIDRQIKAPQIS